MMLLAVGCNFRETPVELRERLAFKEADLPRALGEIGVRYGCEAVILSTCNRVELYLARLEATAPLDADLLAEFLGEWHKVGAGELRPRMYEHREAHAVRHLFRVSSSLDSLIVGEGQIAGQVKQAYETAQLQGSAGPLLHALFQHARAVTKRVRSETGIAQGRVSVSSAAVDYVRQVFDHFGDKTILVIGAGKMGELTLKHLKELNPKRILVTNRSPEKAATVAAGCGGTAWRWEDLDDALARADIILSTTGSSQTIVSRERWEKVLAKRTKGTAVILDIAVPRDFDPAIHDGERAYLFNIDDLKHIRDQTLAARQKHVAPAEAIVEHEVRRFLKEWERRQVGPVIARLTQELEAKRRAAYNELFANLNGRLTDEDRQRIEKTSRQQQNELLHVVITAMTEGNSESGGGKLLDALKKLFRPRE